MENLIESTSYTAQYNAIRDGIKRGDAEITAKFTNGEYAEIFSKASMEMKGVPVEQESIDENSFEENSVEAVGETAEQNLAEDYKQEEQIVDPIEESRRLFDLEQKEAELRIKEVESRLTESLNQEKLEKERLRAELEEARKKIDEYSFDESMLFGDGEKPVETGRDAENVVELPQEVKEKLSKIDELARQIEEEKTWRETVDNYSSFWNTPEGKNLKPNGKPSDVLKSFNEFYSELVEGFGNEKDAFRLMHDIRKHGADKYQDKLGGVALPSEYEKVYDSFELEQFANGYSVDPILGKLVPHNRGTYANLEDAYYILNKDKIRVDDKKKAFAEVQEKLRRRDDSAVAIEPSNYSPINKESEKYQSREYRSHLFERAKRAGFDGKNLNSIKDVSTRDELAPLWAAMNK